MMPTHIPESEVVEVDQEAALEDSGMREDTDNYA